MKTILFTRPEHDPTTHYLSQWCKESVIMAESKGMRVLDLNREKAVRSEVENRLTKFSPRLVVLNGHGNDDFVFLYEPENLSRPLSDNTARMFLEHSQIYVESLIKGNLISEALDRARQNLKTNFVKALSENNTNAVRFLWWDLRHLVSHGQTDVKLE